MAQFSVKGAGLSSLSQDLQALGRLDEEDVYTIITPAGEHLKTKFIEKITSTFQQHTGALAASIQALRKGGGVIQIGPQGVHHRYRARKKKGGGMKNAHASEVAFILNYGGGGHAATHWMDNTLDAEETAVSEKMQEGFDALCEKKGVG